MTAEQVDRFIHAGAAALGLRIAAEHRRGVADYIALAASMAELVEGLPLRPDDESGSVFVPVEPDID